MCITHIIARKITNIFSHMQARVKKNKKNHLFAIFIAKKDRGCLGIRTFCSIFAKQNVRMKLLMVILAVMTWTVKDKNTVTPSGTTPNGVAAEYSSSYQKGTVRNGDEAVLTLTGLGGRTVNGIDIYLHSNSSAGAGEIKVTADGKTVAAKEGTYKSWTGAYSSSSFRAVTVLNSSLPDVKELSISVKGTANSLYIEKYVITYQDLPPRTVTLMKGPDLYMTLTEPYRGEGVQLPVLPDTEEWRFAGWSEQHFWTIYTRPEMYYPALTYIPSCDVTLWAVYAYQPNVSTTYVTDLQTGEYLYVNSHHMTALSGVPSGGKMAYAAANPMDEEQYYTFTFASPDTAFIIHSATHTPIGYSGTSLVAQPSPWLVHQNGEEVSFYTIYKGKKYALWLNVLYQTGDNTVYHAGMLEAQNFTGTPMRLMRPVAQAEAYTCHPEGEMDVENVPARTRSPYILRLGNYELRIHDGIKELRL